MADDHNPKDGLDLFNPPSTLLKEIAIVANHRLSRFLFRAWRWVMHARQLSGSYGQGVTSQRGTANCPYWLNRGERSGTGYGTRAM